MQAKIEELDKWRNMEKSDLSSLPVVKAYDIMLHASDMNECQELASKFKEKVRQSLEGMIKVYEKSTYDVQRYLQWPEDQFQR